MLSYIQNLNKKWKVPELKLSPESKLLLEKIFVRIKEGKLAFTQCHIEFIPLTQHIFGNNYRDIPIEIRDEIECDLKYIYQAKFTIGERHIEFILYSPTRISKNLQKTYLKKVYVWFYVACSFARMNECSRNLKLFVYMTRQKKQFPEKKGQVLSIPHVNAGFTYSCAPSNEIHVYRAEEWFKVVIHETFHSFNLDFSSMDDNISNRIIYEIIPIRLDLRFYEVYTDGWADIIHTCFVAGEKEFKKMIEIERCFALYQAARILYHYGLSYRDIFDTIRNKRYKEGSPVMSYYIIKSCFHFFMGDFFHWCAIHNKSSIQFRHTENNIVSLCNLYRSQYNNSEYMTYLSGIEKVLEKGILKSMENTLRRTILE